jgi:hypothetical protein
VIDKDRPARQDAGMTQLADTTEREYCASVGQRLGMFVRRSSLTDLEAFLVGYDQHALRHGGPGLAGWKG